jgi:integrase
MPTPSLRLQTREARKKLQPRDKPYFFELRRGLHLGYRRGTEGGSWLLREFRSGRYVQRRLAAADDDAQADGVSVLSWTDAQARALGTDRPTVTKPGRYTVAQAAEAYFETRQQGTRGQDFMTYKAFIEAEREGIPDLGERSVSELTTGDLEKWLAVQIPQIDDKDERRAAQATANRRWNVLRAILNSAFRKDSARVPSDGAWRRVRAFPKADRPRTRTISAAEAKRLLSALEGPMRNLARGALLTGLRLGELESLTAADVGKDLIRVRESKSGKPRTVPINKAGATFFAQLITEKAADERVFEQVSRIGVSRQMRAGCIAAKIDPPAVFHDLRRSYGSLLLNAGAAADHIQELLGHADLRMTRRAYAHMKDKTLEKAVKKLPSFG